MTSLRLVWECRWTAKRIQWLLDRDPDTPLTDDDRRRLEAHLAVCEKCAAVSAEYAALHRSLEALGRAGEPGVNAVDRVRDAVARALEADMDDRGPE